MTPIEIRLRCVEIADKLHIAGASDREDRVLSSAQKILDFVTDNGALSDVSAEDITMSALNGLTGMITGLSALNDTKESVMVPAPEDTKAEKKVKVTKPAPEDKPEA